LQSDLLHRCRTLTASLLPLLHLVIAHSPKILLEEFPRETDLVIVATASLLSLLLHLVIVNSPKILHGE